MHHVGCMVASPEPFVVQGEAAREKALRLVEAKSLCRSLPQAERVPFIRPPLTVG